MNDKPQTLQSFESTNTLNPTKVNRLRWAEGASIVLGVVSTVILNGLRQLDGLNQYELGIAVCVTMLFLTASLILRYRWSLTKSTFRRRNRWRILISAVWTFGSLSIPIWGDTFADSHFAALVQFSEICILCRAFVDAIYLTREFTARSGGNPAPLLVGSFMVLIGVGTLLLLLPRAYADQAQVPDNFTDQFRIALFTATSASCVTGLIVVDTPTYWSRMGHAVILGLFQIGGLGIMTCGAFFAVAAGRAMKARERAALHELLEADQPGQVKRLVLGILGFTLISELVGAVCISGLFAEESFGDRVFLSVFHSVSAFCNAGFSLTENSFVGYGHRWQVWGGVCGLIIVGGLGFATLYNIFLYTRMQLVSIRTTPLFNLPKTRPRLSVSARIVLTTTIVLLVGGTISFFLLEVTGRPADDPQANISFGQRISEAWFQAVTFRTAGFNTVDMDALTPATKLLGIMLMFIGAAPGSTGGGIKVTAIALVVLRLRNILQGRQRIEVHKRIIPDFLVNRALTIVALGVLCVMTVTMLLTIFERNETAFMNHLFESVSAFATVGVSAIGTHTLHPISQYVIMVTMFLGRIGPLTLFIALAGAPKPLRYDYPEERVNLG
ncbi:TrkH family potassium uptake protein [Thalassoroseus pseudoceratinae]|uniref:TrkH family potassium uptake protein n=1 Tax=Thalassoroseus pseudoceratinae TaxID=2713176 RepID=UPI0014200CBC|nr:potassium transporter TrkG [Thalassoroseus pseudoceratinae]